MKKLSWLVMMMVGTNAGQAAERIQAIGTSKGRIVFTNLAENPATAAHDPLPAGASAVAERAGGADPLAALIETISRGHGVDPHLVNAVIKVESNFNRWAVSPKGALGLMQLMPETGRRYGVRDFFDPEQNIAGGVRYLRFLLEKFGGNLELSLAAYNAGENLVEKLGRIPSIPETLTYVRKVRSFYKPQVTGVGWPASSTVQTDAVSPGYTIFRRVDDRGVVHFSNIEPPN